MKTIQRITSWSPSRVFQYEECPAKAKFKFIHKLKEPQGDAAARGDMIDKAAEAAISRAKPPVWIPELSQVKGYLEKARRLASVKKVKTQLQLAFTSMWKLTEWFAPDAWARFKLDIAMFPKKDEALIWDVKSGKLRTENGSTYEAQVRSYNLAVLVAGLAKVSRAALLFTDHGVLYEPKKNAVLTIDQLPKEKDYWMRRIAPMFADRLFAPRPGHYCRYCHFRKGNGGPCKF